ncbi:alpha/beta fold hydrolase [Pseudonocardiaceae bacterium YIM PH 21723]|nr:alpha/beta fold hydrolase [Pseudonocardiaceae bacterium YIM PH 21723]
MRVTTADGLSLVVSVEGPAEAPVVLCAHGYPDNRTLWTGLTESLREDHRVVSLDLRGAGDSEAPPGRRGYRIELLAADLVAVADAVSPDRPVHLVAHDWGSIIGWHAVTDPALAHRFSGFTSISGPCLDHIGKWVRSPRDLFAKLRQGLRSWYVGFYHLPWLPESKIDGVWMAKTRPGPPPVDRDVRNGLWIYRVNVLRRTMFPRHRPALVRTRVLAPRSDALIGLPMLHTSPDARVEMVSGGHWLPLENPELIAHHVRDQLSTG